MHKLKFKAGGHPECYELDGGVGQSCYLCKDPSFLKMQENADGTGKYFGVYSHHDVHFNDDDLELVDFMLPEKWTVKVTEENKDVIHRWKLDNTRCLSFTSVGHYVDSEGTWSRGVRSKYTEITYGQFLTHVLKQTTSMVQKLTLGQLKDLHNESGCSDWRNRIVAIINDNVLTKDDSLITIKDEDIKYARQNASESQLKLLKAAGIKFEQKYKEGDWVTFTKDWAGCFLKGDVKQLTLSDLGDLHVNKSMAYGIEDLSTYFRPATEEEIAKARCPYKDGDLLWVKNFNNWELRYSNGNLDKEGKMAICYNGQQKSGPASPWTKHKLANIELPND
jgi:hypothetical protein